MNVSGMTATAALSNSGSRDPRPLAARISCSSATVITTNCRTFNPARSIAARALGWPSRYCTAASMVRSLGDSGLRMSPRRDCTLLSMPPWASSHFLNCSLVTEKRSVPPSASATSPSELVSCAASSRAAACSPRPLSCLHAVSTAAAANVRNPRYRITGLKCKVRDAEARSGRARLLHVPVQLHRRDLLPESEVEELDHDGEAHREVGVALRNVRPKSFGDEVRADQDQERERQHLDRRVAIDERRDRP